MFRGSKSPRDSIHLESISLPPLNAVRKSINLTPGRRIITLKLPKVELNPRDTYFIGFPKSSPQEKGEINRYLSMSVECKKSPSPDLSRESPIRSNVNQYQISLDVTQKFQKKHQRFSIWKIKAAERIKLQKISNMSRKIWKDYVTRPNIDNEFTVKGESRTVKSTINHLGISDNAVYSSAKVFKELVDQKYKKVYEEIDLNRNGYIVLDDIINIVILLGLINQTDKDQSYLSIKNKALEIFQVFYQVSMKSKISRRDFFAVCSVYEYNHPTSSISEFFSLENFHNLRSQMVDLRQVFSCYSKDIIVDPKELRSILACINTDDINQVEATLCSEPVNIC